MTQKRLPQRLGQRRIGEGFFPQIARLWAWASAKLSEGASHGFVHNIDRAPRATTLRAVKTVLAVLVHAIVQLRPENPPAPPVGYVQTVNGVLPIAPPLRDPRLDAVLVLEPAEEPNGSQAALLAAAAPIDVRLFGTRLQPAVIVAAPGRQIVFRNDDRRPVTLFSRQLRELLPSTPLSPGAGVSITAPGAGQYDIGSVEYPHLVGTLLVPRGPASRLEWSNLGELGVAWLDVPAGTYHARLFFLHRYIAAMDVVISPSGATGRPKAAEGPSVTLASTPTSQQKTSEFVLRAVWPTAASSSSSPSGGLP